MSITYLKFTNQKDDNRIKLTTEQKKEIKQQHTDGASINDLARTYNVSRRLIQFITNPESLERAKQQYAERRKDGRYAMSNYESKASWAKRMRLFRTRKRALGLIMKK